jgi:acetoin utilization deacetylase AcuC-like enzyme
MSASRSGARLLPVVHHTLYSAPELPQGHRFPMKVFQRIHDLLITDRIVHPSQIQSPAALPSRTMLEAVHCPEYVAAFCRGQLPAEALRRIGFGDVASQRVLIERTKAEVAGTQLTAELALRFGLAVNTAGGTHHAHRAAGSGFCILNDLAITTENLILKGAVKRVLILDLDVHQGDGTAAIFAGRTDVFTLSVHAANNFPARKQRSHLDVALCDGLCDEDYLQKVAEALTSVLTTFRPDLVLYDAGVDTHADDALGRLSLTDNGIFRRELMVLDTCLTHGVPIAGVVGGGYHADIDVLARRHCLLHRAALFMWKTYDLGM